MKTITPAALGATCLGVQLASNHQVDGFVSVVTAGAKKASKRDGTVNFDETMLKVAY